MYISYVSCHFTLLDRFASNSAYTFYTSETVQIENVSYDEPLNMNITTSHFCYGHKFDNLCF